MLRSSKREPLLVSLHFSLSSVPSPRSWLLPTSSPNRAPGTMSCVVPRLMPWPAPQPSWESYKSASCGLVSLSCTLIPSLTPLITPLLTLDSMLLFVVYFPHHVAVDLDEPRSQDLPDPRSRTLVWLATLITVIVVSTVTAVILTTYPGLSYSWANLLGVTSSILSTIQYFPQIWTTWRLKKVYSLSIAMMCIQVPGAFVFASSLGARVGWSGWSTWVVYVITGFLQGVLLIMALYYRTEEVNSTGESQPNERDPLLPANPHTANSTNDATSPRN